MTHQPNGHCQARPQARLHPVPARTRASDLLRYTILGDLILGHVAPRRMRQAAWRDGLAFSLGSGHQNWLLALMQESSDGNDEGHALLQPPDVC